MRTRSIYHDCRFKRVSIHAFLAHFTNGRSLSSHLQRLPPLEAQVFTFSPESGRRNCGDVVVGQLGFVSVNCVKPVTLRVWTPAVSVLPVHVCMLMLLNCMLHGCLSQTDCSCLRFLPVQQGVGMFQREPIAPKRLAIRLSPKQPKSAKSHKARSPKKDSFESDNEVFEREKESSGGSSQ